MAESNATDELNVLESQGLAKLHACTDEPSLRIWNTEFFGDTGSMRAALGKIGKIPPAERKAYGQDANRVKTALETAYTAALEIAKEASLQLSLTTNPLDVNK